MFPIKTEIYIILLPCGAQYEGMVDSVGKPCAQGKVTTPMRLDSGELYSGYLYNGEPSGNGRISYSNGLNFTGDFVFGLCGVVTDSKDVPLSGFHENVPYFNKELFSGFFVNGRREGYGLMTLADGRTWEGTYSADKMNGVFIYTYDPGIQFELVYSHNRHQSEKQAGPNELYRAADRRVAAELKREILRLEDEIKRVNNTKKQNYAFINLLVQKRREILDRATLNKFYTVVLMFEAGM